MITPWPLLDWMIKSLVIILFMTIGFAYLTLMERKTLARMQTRIGPNRAGPFGSLQPIADAVKAIFKEELTPSRADKLIFVLAPILTVFPMLVMTAVVPWGEQPYWQFSNINVGVLYILAVASISVYGVTLGGWASNNKLGLLGALRSTAQMISYELTLGLAFVGPILLAGSMGILDIVLAQKKLWYIFLQPLGFILYYIATLAEANRGPFDMPEAEQELVAGYVTEYSGMKFAVFFMAEYGKMIAVAMIGASLFLGGFLSPIGFLSKVPVLGILFGNGPHWLMLKTLIWLYTMIWIRATLPRVRFDQLMTLGWKVFFPLGLLNVVVTAIAIIALGG